MKDLVTVEVFKESDFDILSSKDYANFAKSDKVKKLFEEGEGKFDCNDNSFVKETVEMSKKLPGILFEITTLGALFFRYYIVDGKYYEVQGEITFRGFNKINLEPYEYKPL